MEVEIKMKNCLRPCIVTSVDRRKKQTRELKAMFHGWVDVAEIVSAGLTVLDDHLGGTVRDAFALVELEDGTVEKVSVDRIRFVDGGEFESFAWPEQLEGEDNEQRRI